MSWLNGQILKAPELAAKNGVDTGTQYKFGEGVKLWINFGEIWHPIKTIIVGVFIGARGRVHYKLAMEINNTGLYTIVEAPSAMISKDSVTEWTGEQEVDVEDVLALVKGIKPQVSLITARGADILNQLSLDKDMKGFHFKIDAFALFTNYSEHLGEILHKAVNASVPILLRSELGPDLSKGFGFRAVRLSKYDFILSVAGRTVLLQNVTQGDGFPLTARFRIPSTREPVETFDRDYDSTQAGSIQLGDNIIEYLTTGGVN